MTGVCIPSSSGLRQTQAAARQDTLAGGGCFNHRLSLPGSDQPPKTSLGRKQVLAERQELLANQLRAAGLQQDPVEVPAQVLLCCLLDLCST